MSNSVYQNIFSESDLEYINNLSEVLEAKALLETRNVVYFSITLTESLCITLQEHFGLDLSTVSKIPLRWIKGDTPAHIDSGASAFEHTYLVYVNDSEGSFVLEKDTYPIQANTGFKFSEGLSHKTEGTGAEPRLLVGPMNELAEPVGGALVYYYNNYTDAITQNYSIPPAIAINAANGTLGSVTSGSIGSYTTWRIAAWSPGGTPPQGVFSNGFDLGTYGSNSYYVYPSAPCFKEGTKVLCQIEGVDTYEPIESLKVGTLVKTSRDGYKKIEVIKSGIIYNPESDERLEDRLYKCSPEKYPELKEDLYLTGNHSILVDTISESQREQLTKHMGRILSQTKSTD